MPKFICFEGVDGSGKTSQIAMVKSYLEGKGYSVVTKSYPIYESFFGREVGELLSGRKKSKASNVDPKSMALWYALDRWKDYQSSRDEIYGSDIVILNRYTLSSMVYQGLRSRNPEKLSNWVETLENQVLGLPKPNVYLLLDVDPIIAQKNIELKGDREYLKDEKDVYEKNLRLQKRARKYYLKLADDRSEVVVISCCTKTEMLDYHLIYTAILCELQNRGI
jgi:dTMP kinase